MFSKDSYEAARQIVDIIDEMVGKSPSDNGDNDPTRNADVQVERLTAAVNLYGGARMAIAIRILDVFNNQWHTFASIAKQNGAHTEAEALHLVLEHAGLEMQVNDQQLFQLKNFMCGVLPELRRNSLVKPEEELEYVAQCLADSGSRSSLKISANMRNAILLVSKNKATGLTKEDAGIIKDALDAKHEVSRDLEERAGSRKRGNWKRLECCMTVGAEETIFVVRTPRQDEKMVEKIMERYFDVRPY